MCRMAGPVGGRSPQLAWGPAQLFSASISSQKGFCGSQFTSEFGNPTRAWQTGRDQQAHGADSQLVSSRCASKWDEKRSPRDLLLPQDVSVLLAGLGVRSQAFSGHRDPALREDDEQGKPSGRRKTAAMVAIQTQIFVA